MTLGIGYFRNADGEEELVHEISFDTDNTYIPAHGQRCDVITLNARCYRAWKTPLIIASRNFMALVEKWLSDQNLTILPCVDKDKMRCPKCGREMVGLGNVFIEWGKSSGDEYEEEGNADTFVCECGFQMADLRDFDLDEDKVVLELDGTDRHDFGCMCNLCSELYNMSYGVCIRHRGSDECDVERVWGPSREAAMHNARLRCKELGLVIRE